MSLAIHSTPRQNRLLAALPRESYERLLPHLEPVAWPSGWTVHAAGNREDYLHFITAGVVSRIRVTDDGAGAEFAITGNEGVIGLASFLGGESTINQAVVLSPGYSYRLRADRLHREFASEIELLQQGIYPPSIRIAQLATQHQPAVPPRQPGHTIVVANVGRGRATTPHATASAATKVARASWRASLPRTP